MILSIIRKYSVILTRANVQYQSFRKFPKLFYSQKKSSSKYFMQFYPRHLATHSGAVIAALPSRQIILKEKEKEKRKVVIE
jgi:hypothetical protein